MIDGSKLAVVAAVLLGLASPAEGAEPLRPFCPDRPGKDTPPCIVDEGHLVVEASPLTFSKEEDGEVYAVGDVAIRFGLAERVELSLAWTPLVVARLDQPDGDRRTLRGIGDLTGAVKLNLRNPDGEGSSVAVQAFITAPTAKDEIGSGTWEGGVLVPLSFALTDTLGLSLVPEIDLLANEEGKGRHLAVTGVASLSRDLGRGVEASVELWSSLHREPNNRRTEASFDLALAWQPEKRENLQFDLEVDLGLTRATPAVEITAGVATRF